MKKPLLDARKSGILMHISSLPSPYGVGDFGDSARRFVDFCSSASQSYWQVLPLNPVGDGYSPYSSVSSFAIDPMFIDLDELVKKRLVSPRELKNLKNLSKNKVNYRAVIKEKDKICKSAFDRFLAKQLDKNPAFKKYIKNQSHWLKDYALFLVLAKKHKTRNWSHWEDIYRKRNKKELDDFFTQTEKEINFHYFLQFTLDSQWQNLKNYANKKGIGFIGDAPIFVGYESSDVWANQKSFLLLKDGRPKSVAGVPPDFFNKDGQLWGMALYDWGVLKKTQFKWWVDRLKRLAAQFDIVRIDHFIGFYRYWDIPAHHKTAKNGRWRLAGGRELFKEVKKQLGHLPFIAEDLGILVKGVEDLRDDFNLPGMKIMQMGFGTNASAEKHKPYNACQNSVYYTGTHDNNTVVGFIAEAKKSRNSKSKSFDFEQIQTFISGHKAAHLKFIEYAFNSPSQLALCQIQDLTGEGEKSRMNRPGTPTGNWTYRLDKKFLNPKLAKTLKDITILTGRV